MTYWTYLVEISEGNPLQVVACADNRVTYTLPSNKAYLPNSTMTVHKDNVCKIIDIATRNGEPFEWGSAMILVSGYKFWLDNDGLESVKSKIDENGNNMKNATDLYNYLGSLKFTKSCFLGLIYFNNYTKNITYLNAMYSANSKPQPYQVSPSEHGKKRVAYAESWQRTRFASALDQLDSSKPFIEIARLILPFVIKEAATPNQISDHPDSVSSSSSIAIMNSKGKITFEQPTPEKDKPKETFGTTAHRMDFSDLELERSLCGESTRTKDKTVVPGFFRPS